MNPVILILLSFSLILLSGCTTPLYKSVSEIKKGMSKSDVVESLGSPKYTKRSRGRDIWKYVYYKKGIKMSKSFFFEAGHVVKITKTKKKPYLLDQALRAKSIKTYESKVKEYHRAQKEEI